MIWGEALQWGKVCNGFSAPLQIFRREGLQWGEGLQYNTTISYVSKFKIEICFKIFSEIYF